MASSGTLSALGLVAALLWPVVCAAQERWHPIGTSEGQRTWLDRKTILRTGPGIFRVWVKDKYRPSHVFADGTRAADVTTLLEFDCDARRYRFLKSSGYDLEGNLVSSEGRGEAAVWQMAVPETVGELNLDRVCAFTARNPALAQTRNPFRSETTSDQPPVIRKALSEPISPFSEYCRKWGCPAPGDSSLASDTVPRAGE